MKRVHIYCKCVLAGSMKTGTKQEEKCLEAKRNTISQYLSSVLKLLGFF